MRKHLLALSVVVLLLLATACGPTATPEVLRYTPTPIPPTATSVPPSSTPTNTPIPPTNTPTSKPTNTPTLTPVPPTATSTLTLTPLSPTDTPTPVPPTDTPTLTPTPHLTGKMAYVMKDGIYVMDADGSNRRRVYEGDVDVPGYESLSQGIKLPGGVGMAALSPDGSKIAFVRKDGFWVMDANGSGVQQIIADWTHCLSQVAWAPDSNQIIYGKGYIVKIPDGIPQPGVPEVGDWSPDGGWFVYNHHEGLVKRAVSGGPLFVLDSNAHWLEGQPAWSPDGTRIAYTKDGDIFVINADGSGQTKLTDHPAGDWEPRWSPDGSKIVFTSDRDGNKEIYVMSPDGSNQMNLTNSAENEEHPSWAP